MLRFWTLLGLLLLGLTWSAEAEGQDSSELVERVKPYVDREELAGAVMLVANRESILVNDAVGWADRETKRPMSVDSLFWIASQSKPMTAAALMLLVDEGRLSLDDPVEKYLPEFRGQFVVRRRDENQVVLERPAHPITIREVLSHTSGLPFRSALEVPTLDRFSLEARVRSYAMTPLDFEPSTAYQYSNAGINTAARIIEVVAGESYESFMRSRLFDPLGMQDTTFWPEGERLARVATAYRAAEAGADSALEPLEIEQLHYPLDDRSVRTPMPAGGLFSTARDVLAFYQMLLNDGKIGDRQLLSEDAVRELTRRQTPDDVTTSYGLGFMVNRSMFGHGGAYSTQSTADRESGLILIWLVQHASFPGEGAQAQTEFRRTAQGLFTPK